MEQTALRPKPMPGQLPGQRPDDDTGAGPGAPRPHTVPRRRCRRLTAVLAALLLGLVLLLSGIGLGTAGATLIGMSRLAELQRQTGPTVPVSPTASAPTGSPTSPPPAPAPAVATLGVEAVDDEKPGARLVGVHVPGPGYAAGLIRGDVILAFGRTRIDTAADLARAVAEARPGRRAVLTVRHRSGGYQQLTVVPGVVV
ncbi:PDZ domain-containing protein [Streptomyces sp. NPDC007808]|uniref:PDZ domain-containing protein n=1 Tax=Streptomyces sp. NPDC007808 TaxID=3364779 RepID=UPI00367E25FA